jgi:hypothetical protein
MEQNYRHDGRVGVRCRGFQAMKNQRFSNESTVLQTPFILYKLTNYIWRGCHSKCMSVVHNVHTIHHGYQSQSQSILKADS